MAPNEYQAVPAVVHHDRPPDAHGHQAPTACRSTTSRRIGAPPRHAPRSVSTTPAPPGKALRTQPHLTALRTLALPGTPGDQEHVMSGPPAKLSRGLKQRHLTMIAIGGVIGAGLFVGSGVVISNTGPGSFLGYALTGVLIVLVMRMLGEMAAAHPSTGSFADYARRALGGWAGVSVGGLERDC